MSYSFRRQPFGCFPSPGRPRSSTLARLGVFLALTVVATVLSTPPAQGATKFRPELYASIVMNAETGEVLHERNADARRYPASLTKMMTLYLTFEALRDGKIYLDDALPVSAHASSREPSRLGLRPGNNISVKQAILSLVTKSANDAAVVLAEALGETEAGFGEIMTIRSFDLGMKQTRFRNASGLPNSQHASTARDMAILAQSLIRDFPGEYRYFSTAAFTFRGVTYTNQNRLLKTYAGADGIKTGYIRAAGHNLAGSAVRGGKRLIAVVLGGPNMTWTRKHMIELLDAAFRKVHDGNELLIAAAGMPPKLSSPPIPGRSPQPATQPAAGTPATRVAAVAKPSRPMLPRARSADIRRNPETSKPMATPPPSPALRTPPAERPRVAVATGPSAAAAGTILRTPPAAEDTPRRAAAPVLARLTRSGLPDDNAPPRPLIAPLRGRPDRSAAPAEQPSRKEATEEPPPRITRVAIVPPGAAAGIPASAATLPGAPDLASATAMVAPRRPLPPLPGGAREVTWQDAPVDNGRRVAVPARPMPAPPTAPAGLLQPPSPGWSAQIGEFANSASAQRRAQQVMAALPEDLQSIRIHVSPTAGSERVKLRLSDMSRDQANRACSTLQRRSVPCMPVPPGRKVFLAKQ